MLADFLRVGGTVEWITEADDAERCEAMFRHPQFCPKGKAVRFSVADAKKAELTGNKMWSKYPSNMMRARVISNGIRMIAPGIVAGLYTPEEVQDFAEDEPKAHHAVNHDNATGHGSGAYADPETVKGFQQWARFQCEEVNSKWLDFLTGPGGEIRKGPGEIVNEFMLAAHLVKWARGQGLLNAPVDTRAGTRDKYAAVVWDRHADLVKAEAILYCRKMWRDAKAKLDRPKQPVPDDDGDDIPDEVAAQFATPAGDSDVWKEGRE